MRFSLAVAALIPVLAVYADDHLITVGANGQLAFSPTNITAKVGDTVSFQFQSKNHSATQSTFANPCQVQTTPAQGIDSTFQFVPGNATMFPQWSITIDNDTTPLWFFCAQTGHCQKGMVFSINANPDSAKSFAAFQAAAMSQPPPPAAAGGSPASSGGASPSPTGGSASSGSTNAGTNNDGTNPSSAVSGAPGATNSASSGGSSPSGTASNSGLTSNPSGVSSGSTAQQSKKASAMRIGGSSAVSLLAAAGIAAGLLL